MNGFSTFVTTGRTVEGTIEGEHREGERLDSGELNGESFGRSTVAGSRGVEASERTETGGSSEPAVEQNTKGVVCRFNGCASTNGVWGSCGILYRPNAEVGERITGEPDDRLTIASPSDRRHIEGGTNIDAADALGAAAVEGGGAVKLGFNVCVPAESTAHGGDAVAGAGLGGGTLWGTVGRALNMSGGIVASRCDNGAACSRREAIHIAEVHCESLVETVGFGSPALPEHKRVVSS